jgi:hypothetical protein
MARIIFQTRGQGRNTIKPLALAPHKGAVRQGMLTVRLELQKTGRQS